MIEISRNSIIIRNVDLESKEYERFFKAFSIYDEIYHKYFSSVITIIGNDVYVPSTISIKSIQNYFKDKELVYNFANTSKYDTLSFVMKHRPRNDLQLEAIDFLSKIKKDKINHQRFLSLATGSGKTFVSITMVGIIGLKTMIIVDRQELAEQWNREFINHTNIDPSRIKILSGRESIKDAIKNNKKYDVYIAMHRTLGMLLEEDSNSINLLMNKLKIGLRIFDEAHLNMKNMCQINSLSNVEYTLYLTATPSRSGFRDETIYGRVFKLVPYYNGKDNEEIEIPTRFRDVILYKFNTNPSSDVKAACKTPKGFSSAKWARFIEDDGYDAFFECLSSIFINFKLIEKKKKVAIVLPTNNLIEQAKNHFDELFKIETGIYTGKTKKEDKTTERNKDIFFTTDKMFGVGLDKQDLEVLINFCPFSSAVKLEQMVGRIRYVPGKSHVVIDVTDIGFPSCKNQLRLRKKWYSTDARSIKEMKL